MNQLDKAVTKRVPYCGLWLLQEAINKCYSPENDERSAGKGSSNESINCPLCPIVVAAP